MKVWEVVVLVILVGGVLAAGAYGLLLARRDRLAMQRWAKADGWTYTRYDRDLPRRWQGKLFDSSGRTAHHIFEKHRDGVHLIAFTLALGQGSTTRLNLVGRELPDGLPVMTLQPPAVSGPDLTGALVKRAVGVHLLDLPGSDWSAQVPDSGDDEAVRSAVTPGVMRFLESEAVVQLHSRIMFAGSHVFIDNREIDQTIEQQTESPGVAIESRLWVLDELCRLVRV